MLSTLTKKALNRCLAPLNLCVGTLTAERAEIARLSNLDGAGQFRNPVFPVLPEFSACNPEPIFRALARFNDKTKQFSAIRHDKYSFLNNYFSSPDAEVAYALVREMAPRRIIEVGSGNSTRLFREAIQDGNMTTELVSIDPSPRTSIEAIADRVIRARLEETPIARISESLVENDILFIDSSHDVRTGNDVIQLMLNIIPALSKGVVIHVHDIFLPYEYPREWIVGNRWTWNEQYIVQAMLQGSRDFEVLWPGHYLQRTVPDFASWFGPHSLGSASSLWLKKIA